MQPRACRLFSAVAFLKFRERAARGRAAVRLVLVAAAPMLLAATALPVTAEATASQKLTVVVLVVDSLMPDELGQSYPATPNLTLLRDEGTSYAHSRSVFTA